MGKSLEMLKQIKEELIKAEIPKATTADYPQIKPEIKKAMPRPKLRSYKQMKADEGVRGVHSPISQGSGHSTAGIMGAGAKPGSSDSKAAIKEHKQVLREIKEIAMKPGQSFRDVQKSAGEKKSKLEKDSLGFGASIANSLGFGGGGGGQTQAPPPPPPTQTSGPTISDRIGNPFGKSEGEDLEMCLKPGMSYKDMKKANEKGVHAPSEWIHHGMETKEGSSAGNWIRNANKYGKDMASSKEFSYAEAKQQHKDKLKELKAMPKPDLGKAGEHQPHPGPSLSEHQKIYDAKKQAKEEAALKEKQAKASNKAPLITHDVRALEDAGEIKKAAKEIKLPSKGQSFAQMKKAELGMKTMDFDGVSEVDPKTLVARPQAEKTVEKEAALKEQAILGQGQRVRDPAQVAKSEKTDVAAKSGPHMQSFRDFKAENGG